MSTGGNPIAIVCTHCGSRDVSRDAWGEWNETAQEWVLRTVFDFAYCHRCDCERSLEERSLDERERATLSETN